MAVGQLLCIHGINPHLLVLSMVSTFIHLHPQITTFKKYFLFAAIAALRSDWRPLAARGSRGTMRAGNSMQLCISLTYATLFIACARRGYGMVKLGKWKWGNWLPLPRSPALRSLTRCSLMRSRREASGLPGQIKSTDMRASMCVGGQSVAWMKSVPFRTHNTRTFIF